MVSIPPLEGINWFGFIAEGVYWIGIALLAGAILGIMYAIFYTMKFNIKAFVFPLYGSGTDGIFSVGKMKVNRVKWINNRTAWKRFFPLMNKNEDEPFDAEYIYPGNRIIAFDLNGQWMPGRFNIKVEPKDEKTTEKQISKVQNAVNKFIKRKFAKTSWYPVKVRLDKDEETIRGEVNPIPHYVRNWQSLQHKKNAVEFAKQGFWEDNKTMIMTIMAVFACCALVGATVYFTYEFAAGGTRSMEALTQAIKGFGQIPGAGIIPK